MFGFEQGSSALGFAFKGFFQREYKEWIEQMHACRKEDPVRRLSRNDEVDWIMVKRSKHI